MRVYIDVTNLTSVDFLTGIQRVVREVLVRMIRERKHELILMTYNDFFNIYEKIDVDSFYAWFNDGEGEHEEMFTGKKITYDCFMPGDVFFDIDSVWNLSLKRSLLLPKLKANGVKILVYIYDIIPITHPQYCHGNTTNNFMSYIGAFLQYADMIFASTQSTLDAIDDLLRQLKLPSIPGCVTWLGSDFKVQDNTKEEIHPKAKAAVDAGQYVLMVGTIEPRKNHAVILDAFEKQLFSKGMNLIFAGKIGWNIQAFRKRMMEHPMYGKQFFFLNCMNDVTIDYLYKHAYCVAFPTFNEGFGLPMIEAFERGVPVIASDIPVLREVGKGYCRYFDPNSWHSFAEQVEQWLNHEDDYAAEKEKLKGYIPVTWDSVATVISDKISSLESVFPYEMPERLRQIVYLTARADDILRSLPYVENYMPFIEEVVLCCPDHMVKEMKNRYKGHLAIKYITDSELLATYELPEDHAERNFFLRCLVMQNEHLDPVFLMSDDDYRPLYPITDEIFLKDGKYCAYYCYRLQDWVGKQSDPTSFDCSMYETRNFLEENGYPTLMYDSHMPQVIDRRVFCEILKEHPGIERRGLSEWSVYFDYFNAKYPNQIVTLPYISICWPGGADNWNMALQPRQYVFENHYDILYEDKSLFGDLPNDFHENMEYENVEKIVRYMNSINAYNQARVMFQAYRENYNMLYGEDPFFQIGIMDDDCTIQLPEYIAVCENEFTRIPFLLDASTSEEQEFELEYSFLDILGNPLQEGECMTFSTTWDSLQVPVRGIGGGVKATFCLTIRYKGKEYRQYSKLCIMRKNISDGR